MSRSYPLLVLAFSILAYLPNAYSADAPKSISSLVKLDLGEIQLDQAISQDIKVTVPEGFQSLTVQVEGLPNYQYEFATIKDPSGELIRGKSRLEIKPDIAAKYPDLQNLLSLDPMTPNPFDGYTSAMIPNSPQIKLKTGQYIFKVLATSPAVEFESHKIHVIAYLKKIEQEISANVYGRIDLNLNFSGNGGLKEETYKTDPKFQIFMEKLQERLLSAHIIARIKSAQNFKMDSYTSVENSIAVISKDVATAKVSPALNVFFTTLKEDGGTRGISMGVPGPFMSNKGVLLFNLLMGTDASFWDNTSPEDLALFAAHEIGHYLGLFHACDVYAEEILIPNPIADTTCQPNINIMEDGVRLSNLGFSEQQKQVMFYHPLIELFEIKDN